MYLNMVLRLLWTADKILLLLWASRNSSISKLIRFLLPVVGEGGPVRKCAWSGETKLKASIDSGCGCSTPLLPHDVFPGLGLLSMSISFSCILHVVVVFSSLTFLFKGCSSIVSTWLNYQGPYIRVPNAFPESNSMIFHDFDPQRFVHPSVGVSEYHITDN